MLAERERERERERGRVGWRVEHYSNAARLTTFVGVQKRKMAVQSIEKEEMGMFSISAARPKPLQHGCAFHASLCLG